MQIILSNIFLIFLVGFQLYKNVKSSTSYNKSLVDNILFNIYGSFKKSFSLEEREVAYVALNMLHKHFPKLERKCYINDCQFNEIENVFPNIKDRTKFFSILLCAKYGASCSANGYWNDWQAWSRCTPSCIQSQSTRFRTCEQPEIWGKPCDYHSQMSLQVRNCSIKTDLCANLPPGSWTDWSKCSVSCGRGYQSRSWMCEQSNEVCDLKNIQKRDCSKTPCSVNGGWNIFRETVSNCHNLICGQNYRILERKCTSPRPVGDGLICVGPSAKVEPCKESLCENSADKLPVVYFQPSSSLYLLFKSSLPFFTLTLRFKLLSLNGTLLRFHINDEMKLTSDNYLSLHVAKNRIIFQFQLRNCVPILIPTTQLKIDEWNVFRLDVVERFLTIRTNERHNIFEEFLDDKSSTESCLQNPFFQTYQGVMSVGSWKDELGFRGYVSLLRINYQNYNFENLRNGKSSKDSSERIKTIQVHKLKSFHFAQQRLHENNLLFFNGLTRMKVVFPTNWWLESTKLELIVKPFRPNCLILVNKGKFNQANRIKLLFEKGRRFRFTFIWHGGQVTSVKSLYNSATIYQWNKISIFWQKNNTIKMKVNSEPDLQLKIPSVKDQMSNPGESWLIGGPLKNRELSSNMSLMREVLTTTFRGYVYSFKKDGIETLTKYQKATNIEGFLPILSSSLPRKLQMKSVPCDQDEPINLICRGRTNQNLVWYKDEEPFKGQTQKSSSKSTLTLSMGKQPGQVTGVYSCSQEDSYKDQVLINFVVRCAPEKSKSKLVYWIPVIALVTTLILVKCIFSIATRILKRRNKDLIIPTNVELQTLIPADKSQSSEKDYEIEAMYEITDEEVF